MHNRRPNERPNDQYNLAAPDSLAVRIGAHVRQQMFGMFMSRLKPTAKDLVLDVGATSDRVYSVSNYFESFYPFKERLTATGIDDASFLEALHPGVRFVQANALELPFADASFDLVHSSAVLEHVGSFDHQAKMIRECLRVARRGIFVTTPNRWFPIEFHTQLPFVHWLPTRFYREVFRKLGYEFFADESNLNLLWRSQLGRILPDVDGWTFKILSAKLLGLNSNLILVVHRDV